MATNQTGIQPDHYDTCEAARRLLRKPQTLRKWSCDQNGPITPVHVAGRLLWRRSDIEALLAGQKVSRS